MTVNELIEVLKQCNQNAHVNIYFPNYSEDDGDGSITWDKCSVDSYQVTHRNEDVVYLEAY